MTEKTITLAMRRYATRRGAARGDGVAENAMRRAAPRRSRRRRHRAWRITDLASSGPAAPDIPSTTVRVSPYPPFDPVPFHRGHRDVDRPGTARPHAPARLLVSDTPSFLFITRRRSAALHSASAVSRCAQSAELPRASGRQTAHKSKRP